VQGGTPIKSRPRTCGGVRGKLIVPYNLNLCFYWFHSKPQYARCTCEAKKGTNLHVLPNHHIRLKADIVVNVKNYSSGICNSLEDTLVYSCEFYKRMRFLDNKFALSATAVLSEAHSQPLPTGSHSLQPR
jgi:hypothetical protein